MSQAISASKPRRYKPIQHFELGEIVYRQTVGPNTGKQYGKVVGYDFFGGARINWD